MSAELQTIKHDPTGHVPVAAAVAPDSAIISMIERAARDPNVDIDKMERLMAMQERVVMRNAETAFNAAMQIVQSELPQVTRDAKNDQTRSRYARLETISLAIKPVITANGFSISYGTDASPLPDHYGVTCLVAHSGGFSRLYRADIPTDANGMKGNQNKTATHAFGSTMSYGRRYLLLMVFDIALTNEDDDGQAAGRRPPPDYGNRREYDAEPVAGINQAQRERLRVLIDEVGADTRRFCAYLRVEGLSSLPTSRFDEAVRALEAKRGRK